MSFQVIFVLTM